MFQIIEDVKMLTGTSLKSSNYNNKSIFADVRLFEEKHVSKTCLKRDLPRFLDAYNLLA